MPVAARPVAAATCARRALCAVRCALQLLSHPPHTHTHKLSQRYIGCADRGCELCRHNPAKRCADNFDEAYPEKAVRAIWV